MISLQSEELMEIRVEDLMIPSEKVAFVQGGNPIEHALLILVKSGYSAVPVLGPEYRLQGIISKSLIIENVMGIERFEFENLSNIRVESVMNSDIPHLKRTDQFTDGLEVVINHPFVCVVDDEGFFDGILTRRAMLKSLNRHLHNYKYKTQSN